MVGFFDASYVPQTHTIITEMLLLLRLPRILPCRILSGAIRAKIPFDRTSKQAIVVFAERVCYWGIKDSIRDKLFAIRKRNPDGSNLSHLRAEDEFVHSGYEPNLSFV